ncbi:MAG: hypothetical protein R3Y29_03200 [bacterium]
MALSHLNLNLNLSVSLFNNINVNNALNTSNFFLTALFIMLLGMIILQFFSAYSIYYDAQLREQNPTYWCIYDLFITNYGFIGTLGYYFFAVKKYNDCELNIPVPTPRILILKFIYFILFIAMCYIYYINIIYQLGLFGIYSNFIINVYSYIILLLAVIAIPLKLLKFFKIWCLCVIYKTAEEKVPDEALTWGIFSIFFTSVTILLFIFLVIKNKSLNNNLENFDNFENHKDDNFNNKVHPILYVYLILNLFLNFGIVINIINILIGMTLL